ncbi:hypothetical protein Hanom_Chr01g00056641 [Helianthus anomalus]
MSKIMIWYNLECRTMIKLNEEPNTTKLQASALRIIIILKDKLSHVIL